MSDRLYDILNKVQRWLPALGAFYLGLCEVWGAPFGNEVNKTIVLIAALIAATLEISTVQYHKNQVLNAGNFDGDPKGGEDL